MTHPIDLALGRRIRCRRVILELTQAQIATACGIRFQQIQKYECAANALSVRRLVEVARALDLKPGVLVDGLEEYV